MLGCLWGTQTMRRRVWCVLACVSLLGCVTPYQRAGLTGGYSETELDENVFEVWFRGNAYTSAQRAADFTLLRCAELALEHGFTHFCVVESSHYTKLGSYTTPSTSYTTGSVYSSGYGAYGSATTTTHGGQTYITSKPRAAKTIVCFKGKPKTDAVVYDAGFVCNSIEGKYGIGEQRGRKSGKASHGALKAR